MKWEESNCFLIILQNEEKHIRRLFVCDKSVPKLDEESFRRSLISEFFKKNWYVKSISKVENNESF
jgi:hypothetical protein